MKRLLLFLAACGSSSSDDVTGPFTGTTQRFVVDRISVPRTTQDTDRFAGDLDGNGMRDNKLGLVASVLATTNDATFDQQDMIASGALASYVEIQANDLTDDDSVGVRYFGGDGEPATVCGGTFVAGAYRSNRAATTKHPGRAIIHLPVYTNSDPLHLTLEGLEIDLDPDGAGGFDATIRGGIRQSEARMVAYAGLEQMFLTEPERHLVFQRQVDTDHDGTMSMPELEDSVIAILVTADIRLFDGSKYDPDPDATIKDSLSMAFGVHLSPCETGTCSTAAPMNTCRDRIRDGDETDVDCGGSCQKCAAMKTCTQPSDCQTSDCIAGTCAPASCTDGVRDGYESDVDCGSACGKCGVGQICAAGWDCASNSCNNDVATTGRCIGP
jgi:hypothetical protein